MSFHVRWMIQVDIPIVMEIEGYCFEHPWTEDILMKHLRHRNRVGMVVEDHREGRSKDVIGFMVYELHKTRLHLMNISVHPEFRGIGAGYVLWKTLHTKLFPGKRERISLEVRESWLNTQQWLRRQGFKATSILHGFCRNPPEDAYRFEFDVTETVETKQWN